MNTETLVLVVTLTVIGIPAVVALFLIVKSLGAVSTASRQGQALIEALSNAVTQASTQSIQASESITKLEQRVAEALALIDVRTKEDRQIVQSIAVDNRQALRDAAQTIKERLSDLKERMVGFSETFKAEAIETRKWKSEKATERLVKEKEYQGQLAEKIVSAIQAINERLDSVGKQISEKIDQGSRLSQRTLEAKTEELIVQLKGIPAIQDEIRSVVSQLEQNRGALEKLRISIVDDVTTLTGD
ncbi:MAG: hypothetical protein AB1656_16610 [Candidatus Omnitrophota bacterium]